MQTLTIIQPDDMHLHLRDGEALKAVLPFTARQMGRAVIMPNLKPPVASVADALAYRARIEAALPEGSTFEPLMTLYLTDNTTPDDVRGAKASGFVHAAKLYPAGATTNSDSGVTSLDGVRRLHAYRYNPEFRFYINVGASEEAYLAPWYQQRRGILGLLALFVMLSGAAVFMLHRYAGRLAERERVLRTIFDTSDGAIFLVAPDGRIVFANEWMSAMWGIPVAQLIGNGFGYTEWLG